MADKLSLRKSEHSEARRLTSMKMDLGIHRKYGAAVTYDDEENIYTVRFSDEKKWNSSVVMI